LLDVFAINFQFPDMVVYAAIGLGLATAVGLVIREQVQGGETGVSKQSTQHDPAHE